MSAVETPRQVIELGWKFFSYNAQNTTDGAKAIKDLSQSTSAPNILGTIASALGLIASVAELIEKTPGAAATALRSAGALKLGVDASKAIGEISNDGKLSDEIIADLARDRHRLGRQRRRLPRPRSQRQRQHRQRPRTVRR